ncbi:hypothetical protein Hanom_Chr07g00652581 [Helianthus anomalus]
MYIRYRYPLLLIWVTVFSVPVGTELIKSCSNVAMKVIVLFKKGVFYLNRIEIVFEILFKKKVFSI